MKTILTVACCLLAGYATAADSRLDCTIKSIRERVIAEHTGGPQPPVEERDKSPSTDKAGVFEVTLVCAGTNYFALFTRAGKFTPERLLVGRAVRVR